MEYSTSCKLQKGDRSQVAYIPKRFAVLGKYVNLAEDGDGWRVIEIYHSKPAKEVHERERDHLKQREASDI